MLGLQNQKNLTKFLIRFMLGLFQKEGTNLYFPLIHQIHKKFRYLKWLE